MASNYPDNQLDIQFAGLVEAATAAADAHQRDLGKRKRGEEDAYIPVSIDAVFTEAQPRTPTLTNSAAVLFREPSEKSKKYSRPPLGKVFTSLELQPEAFLKLQNEAKAYMLSDEYPERKDVVGHKKNNSNNDQAKLKLYQCVEDFLRQDENGEKFFGHSSIVNGPDAEGRTFFWPEDGSRIVKLLMPLLRKMVTNERQRIYAAETRKSDPKKSKDAKRQRTDESEEHDTQLIDDDMAPEIDPSLQMKDDVNSALPIDQSAQHDPNMPSEHTGLTLRVNIVARDEHVRKRIIPEFSMTPESAGTFDQFLNGLGQSFDNLSRPLEIKAMLPQGGLVPVKSEEDWIMSQAAVFAEEWMNGQLQVVVEV